MLNKIDTKFKNEIHGFDRTEICTICQYTFNECSSKLVHLKCGHYYHERCFVLGIATNDECDWKCLICRKDVVSGQKKIESKREVQNPFGQMNSNPGSLYLKCSKCGMKFRKGPLFTEHLKLTKHHNGRKYGCRVCKSIFMSHHELMSHVFSVGHNSMPTSSSFRFWKKKLILLSTLYIIGTQISPLTEISLKVIHSVQLNLFHWIFFLA